MTSASLPLAGASSQVSASAPESLAKDAAISWYRSEFAAANAIIDALCRHLAQISGEVSGCEYGAVFAALHQRRANWIPVLHMQRFYSIAGISDELRLIEVRQRKPRGSGERREAADEVLVAKIEKKTTKGESESCPVVEKSETEYSDEHPAREIPENGSQEQHNSSDGVCSNREDCLTLPERIKILKGFVAKEAVKGHMVNVVKGLKIYEDIFIDSELAELSEFIDELRQAGRKGELAGESFIFFNKQMKGNKREIIQLGVPLFQSTSNETSSIEQIPPVLQSIIDHLVQWRLIPENRKPNSCIINFFDENEHSQPYFKPPHLDNPISTLVLTETTVAFGRSIACNANGNYKGSLTLDIKEGSLLVMRGNSSDIARHVICPSSNRRVTITFLKVKPSNNNQVESPKTPLPSKAMTLWQPGTPQIPKVPTSGFITYGPQTMVPTTYGLTFRTPVVMLAPPRTMLMSPPSKQMGRGGTGVFLPWTVSIKKYTKHVPPRIQKRRLQFTSIPSPPDA